MRTDREYYYDPRTEFLLLKNYWDRNFRDSTRKKPTKRELQVLMVLYGFTEPSESSWELVTDHFPSITIDFINLALEHNYTNAIMSSIEKIREEVTTIEVVRVNSEGLVVYESPLVWSDKLFSIKDVAMNISSPEQEQQIEECAFTLPFMTGAYVSLKEFYIIKNDLNPIKIIDKSHRKGKK